MVGKQTWPFRHLVHQVIEIDSVTRFLTLFFCPAKFLDFAKIVLLKKITDEKVIANNLNTVRKCPCMY